MQRRNWEPSSVEQSEWRNALHEDTKNLLCCNRTRTHPRTYAEYPGMALLSTNIHQMMFNVSDQVRNSHFFKRNCFYQNLSFKLWFVSFWMEIDFRWFESEPVTWFSRCSYDFYTSSQSACFRVGRHQSSMGRRTAVPRGAKNSRCPIPAHYLQRIPAHYFRYFFLNISILFQVS